MDDYVLSLSYGKDSLACLGAIEQLGLPLTRIIHAEVWATDTIPADLPPMMEFKAKADRIIKERWGIEVEHVCATRKVSSQTINVERERESKTQNCDVLKHTKANSTLHISTNAINSLNTYTKTEFTDFHSDAEVGAIQGLKLECLTVTQKEILTYEKCFYHKYAKSKDPKKNGLILGFPITKGNWCTSQLKINTNCF